MLRLSLLGKDLETRLLASVGEERVTTPPCGLASVAPGRSASSSGNTSSLSRSAPSIHCQTLEAKGFPRQQPSLSHSQQRQQQQQKERLGSAFAPYVPPPGLTGPSATAAAGANTVPRSDGATCPDPATISKLAQLLLGQPQASNQLTAMVAALKSGQSGAEPTTLATLESCGSTSSEQGRKRPLEALSSLGRHTSVPHREPSQQQQEQQCLAAHAPAPSNCAFTADTLQRLACLLVEVPSLSDSLEKALWGGLGAQQQRGQQPGAKRSKLSSTPAAETASERASMAPSMPQQATADIRLGAILALPTPPAGEPLGAPASINPSRPHIAVARTAVPVAAGAVGSQPAILAAAPPRQPGRLRAGHQLLPPSAATQVLRSAAYQQQQQQRTAPAQPSHAATTARAAGGEAEGPAGASMDEIKQAVLVWRYLKARKQKREAETALLRYCSQGVQS